MYFFSSTTIRIKIINKVYTFTIYIQIDVTGQHTDMGSEYLYTQLNILYNKHIKPWYNWKKNWLNVRRVTLTLEDYGFL